MPPKSGWPLITPGITTSGWQRIQLGLYRHSLRRDWHAAFASLILARLIQTERQGTAPCELVGLACPERLNRGEKPLGT